jgi:hypothetical protein
MNVRGTSRGSLHFRSLNLHFNWYHVSYRWVPADEKKTHLNFKVSPQLKTTREAFASREKRSVSNLAETLLDWAVERTEMSSLLPTTGVNQKQKHGESMTILETTQGRPVLRWRRT